MIESYGAGGFRVGGRVHIGSVIVLSDRVVAWPVHSLTEIDPGSLGPVLESAANLDILVLGCGQTSAPAADAVRQALAAAKVALEVMGTGAACRTFNVLQGEGRRVAAALLAVP